MHKMRAGEGGQKMFLFVHAQVDPPPSPCRFGLITFLQKSSIYVILLVFHADEFEQRNLIKKMILWQFLSDCKAFGALKTTFKNFQSRGQKQRRF